MFLAGMHDDAKKYSHSPWISLEIQVRTRLQKQLPHCRLLPASVVSTAATAFHAVRMEPSFAVKSTVVAIYGECRVLLNWK